MPLLLLLAATSAVIAGSTACAARLERESFSRRLLLIGVLVPAQITVLVLAVGWLLGAFRPLPLLGAALAVGWAQVVGLRTRGSWSGPMSPRRALERAGRAARRNPLITLVVAVAVAFTGWQSVRAARVPVTSWDSLMYHLPEPSTWVLTGRVDRSGLSLFGAGYPQGQEVLHGWTMVFLHSIRGTGLVPLWLAATAALAIYRIARHLGATRASAVLGAAVFASMPAAALQISTAYVDLGAAALGLAALALGLEARHAEQPFGLLLGATTAAALAVAMKPSTVPVVLAVAAIGVAASLRHRRDGVPRSTMLRRWAVGAVVLAVLGGFWYLRNYATYRNPVYPVSMLGFRGAGSFDELVRSVQAPASLVDQIVPVQVWRSWTADLKHHDFVYDQRLGGLGAVWLLVCVPSLAFLTVRLWSRDRGALAVLGGAGIATTVITGSMWWSRYTLLLAGIGCVALALSVDAVRGRRRIGRHEKPRRTERLWGPALLGTILVLVGFTTVSAVAPSSEYALENTVPLQRMGAGQLASWMLHGADDADFRPWGAAAGLREVPEGEAIAYVKPAKLTFPQLALGIDLDHRLIAMDPPANPDALDGALRGHETRFLLLPDPLTPGAVETVAVHNRLRYRPVRTTGLLTGISVWEFGFFDECAGGRLTVTVTVHATTASIAGRATDRCGALGAAPIELWAAGPGHDLWTGATRVLSGTVTDEGGNFLRELPREAVSTKVRYLVRFPGREDADHYRPPSASNVVSVRS